MPTVAECGGFLYLQSALKDENGTLWPMVGALGGTGYGTDRLQRFGYLTLTGARDSLLLRAGEAVPAHEFHYWDCTDCGADMTAGKANGEPGPADLQGKVSMPRSRTSIGAERSPWRRGLPGRRKHIGRQSGMKLDEIVAGDPQNSGRAIPGGASTLGHSGQAPGQSGGAGEERHKNRGTERKTAAFPPDAAGILQRQWCGGPGG